MPICLSTAHWKVLENFLPNVSSWNALLQWCCVPSEKKGEVGGEEAHDFSTVQGAPQNACLHCGPLWEELVHLLSWMLFHRWRAPVLCLPCVLGTLCISDFAPHIATNPLSFVTLFLSGIICLPPFSHPLHLYCFSVLFVTILLKISICMTYILRPFFCRLVSLFTCIICFSSFTLSLLLFLLSCSSIFIFIFIFLTAARVIGKWDKKF